MRVLPIVLASAAGLALAGISDDPIECLSGCSGKTLTDNSHIAGKRCTAATQQDVQLDCICESEVLITALDACILSICLRPFANIDIDRKLRRNCIILPRRYSIRIRSRHAARAASCHRSPMLDVIPVFQPLAPVGPLPIELLADIIEYLSPAERRGAASVSRHFRQASHVAGFAIHYHMHWYSRRTIQKALPELTGLVLRIARDNLRISLDFVCRPVDGYGALEEWRAEFLEIIRIMSTAMPYMASFKASIPEPFRAAFDTAVLDLPAPQLRYLQFSSSWSRSPPPITDSILSGDAPTLRDLSLSYIALPAQPIRAFARVRKLHILCDDENPPAQFASHFPALKVLHAEYISYSRDPIRSLDWVKQSFARLSLDELTIDYHLPLRFLDAIQHVLSVRDIRVVRFKGGFVPWHESLFGAPGGPLCACLHTVPLSMQLTIRPEHQKWTRVFVVQQFYPRVPPCASLRDGLTYVRLEAGLISAFLNAILEMPALRELRVDLGVPQGGARYEGFSPCSHRIKPECIARDPNSFVLCPRLEALTVFALDGPMEIDSLEAAQVGCLLGQAGRRKDERARLVLVGVTFPNGFEHAWIENTYSSV